MCNRLPNTAWLVGCKSKTIIIRHSLWYVDLQSSGSKKCMDVGRWWKQCQISCGTEEVSICEGDLSA